MPYPLLLERSRNELVLFKEAHERLFQLGAPDSSWAVDLKTGTITFTSKEFKATASVQIVGTLYQGAWLWAWANPSIPRELCAHAEAVKAYGVRHNIEALKDQKIKCSESDGWDFTALACKLGGAQGGYRAPNGNALVFMTYGEPSVSKL